MKKTIKIQVKKFGNKSRQFENKFQLLKRENSLYTS